MSIFTAFAFRALANVAGDPTTARPRRRLVDGAWLDSLTAHLRRVITIAGSSSVALLTSYREGTSARVPAEQYELGMTTVEQLLRKYDVRRGG